MKKVYGSLLISLCALVLTACDNKNKKTDALQSGITSVAPKNNQVKLLGDKVSLELPNQMIDRGGTLKQQANNTFFYSDNADLEKIIIMVTSLDDAKLPEFVDAVEKQRTLHGQEIVILKKEDIKVGNYAGKRLDMMNKIDKKSIYTSLAVLEIDKDLVIIQFNLLPEKSPDVTIRTVLNSIVIASSE